MTAIAVLNGASVISAIVAAALWIWSTKVRVEPDPSENDYTITDVRPGRKDVDVLKTIEQQSVWNSRAALVTGLAVALQAASLFIQHFSL